MKKASQVPRERIDACDIRTLRGVAMEARKRKILQRCWTAMLLRNDVVDLIRGRIVFDGKVAVFADAVGADEDGIRE